FGVSCHLFYRANFSFSTSLDYKDATFPYLFRKKFKKNFSAVFYPQHTYLIITNIHNDTFSGTAT
ncbi:MAG: hypothetical protein LBI60_02235, partial [Bacteroidales bacterium]|nr:hypothetical protein [Bacteroidales bacterium]